MAKQAAAERMPAKQNTVALKKGRGTGTVKQSVVHLASSEEEQHEYGSKEWASWIVGEADKRAKDSIQEFLSAQLHRQVSEEQEYELTSSALERWSNEGKMDWRASAKFVDINC